jgi:ureidoacrylate peracid hydrolase
MPASRIALGREFFSIDPRRSALIIIDMQNAFVAEGAPFEIAGARAMIPDLERLITFARSHQMPIVWTQSDHRPPFGGIMLKKFPDIREKRVLWAEDKTFQLYPRMIQPRLGPHEHVMLKHKFDAFFETDLDAVLRYHRIETIIVTGTATNACCESTARSAFMRDYQVAFPSDANATFDLAMHEASLKNVDLLFGRVMTVNELLGEMEQSLATGESRPPARRAAP